MKVKSLSHVRLLATPWTEAHQAPPSMGFSRQENWSGVPLPSPRVLFNHLLSGINKNVVLYLFHPVVVRIKWVNAFKTLPSRQWQLLLNV